MVKSSFAAALGKIPSGIFVVTARRGTEEAALLASWVQQASFEPPAVSLAVRNDRPIARLLEDRSFFGVHVLAKENRELYERFVRGTPPGSNPFAGVDVERSAREVPVLTGALAFLECRVRNRVTAGDHTLVLGEVLDGRLLSEGEPWCHVRKNGLAY